MVVCCGGDFIRNWYVVNEWDMGVRLLSVFFVMYFRGMGGNMLCMDKWKIM